MKYDSPEAPLRSVDSHCEDKDVKVFPETNFSAKYVETLPPRAADVALGPDLLLV